MIQGETSFFLSSDNSSNYWLIPPPASQEGTTYAAWQWFDCSCDALPLWIQHSSCAISGAAQTYRMCYTPAEWYNKFVFNICCCGDKNCCDGMPIPFCIFCTIGVSIPKLICCSLGTASAFVSGTLGGMYDLVSCAPCRQSMDVTLLPDQPLLDEAKENPREEKSKVARTIPTKINALCIQLDEWIKQDNLPMVLKFFSNPINFEMVNYEIYHRRIFLICLAIRYPGEEITLQQRIKFIKQLIQNDKTILNKYDSIEGEEIPAALLEALRSEYVYSGKLLEFCCIFGANVHQPVGHWTNNPSNFLQVWACSDFLTTTEDNILCYKLRILSYYENRNRPKELVTSFEEEKLKELDQKLTSMVDESVQNLSSHEKGKRRDEVRSYLTVGSNLPRNVGFLIGQYSAFFSPYSQVDGSSEKSEWRK